MSHPKLGECNLSTDSSRWLMEYIYFIYWFQYIYQAWDDYKTVFFPDAQPKKTECTENIADTYNKNNVLKFLVTFLKTI